MSPRRPYLLRALIEWITDNVETPYVLVQAGEGVQVPSAYVSDGRIVLNVSPMAIRNLSISNEYLMFDGRFGGQSFAVSVPMHAVAAVYSKESGEGSLFESEYPVNAAQPGAAAISRPEAVDTSPDSADSSGRSTGPRTPRSRGHLRPVK